MKTAIVLFNLGGPDRLEAVRPFLFNLFSDKAIISLPNPFRMILASVIARQRAPVAQAIYQQMGGNSPIRSNTKQQAIALEGQLGSGFKVFIAMRYWHPRAREAVKAVREWQPDRVVLLPLYPQYSTTTTASSLGEWRREAVRQRLNVPTVARCCWPREDGFVESVAMRVREGLALFPSSEPQPRVLFSAHGLPERIVEAGDPYAWQVEQSVARVVANLGKGAPECLICYQSRVGPLKWIGPATETLIREAGAEKRSLLIVPIAFVSEHSETLVELDIEYAHLAKSAGVPRYVRTPTVDTSTAFIGGLARLVATCETDGSSVASGEDKRICPRQFTRCPLTQDE